MTRTDTLAIRIMRLQKDGMYSVCAGRKDIDRADARPENAAEGRWLGGAVRATMFQRQGRVRPSIKPRYSAEVL